MQTLTKSAAAIAAATLSLAIGSGVAHAQEVPEAPQGLDTTVSTNVVRGANLASWNIPDTPAPSSDAVAFLEDALKLAGRDTLKNAKRNSLMSPTTTINVRADGNDNNSNDKSDYLKAAVSSGSTGAIEGALAGGLLGIPGAVIGGTIGAAAGPVIGSVPAVATKVARNFHAVKAALPTIGVNKQIIDAALAARNGKHALVDVKLAAGNFVAQIIDKNLAVLDGVDALLAGATIPANIAAQNLEAVRFVINGVQVAVNLPLSLLGTKFAVANIAAQALDAVRVLHNGKQIIAAGLAIPVFIGLKKFNKILKIKNGIDTLAFGAAALKRIALKVLDRILLIKNGAVVLASGLFVVHNLFKAALAEGIHLLTVLPGIVLSALGFAAGAFTGASLGGVAGATASIPGAFWGTILGALGGVAYMYIYKEVLKK